MKWFRSTLEGAGLARYGSLNISVGIIGVAGFFGYLVATLFKVPSLGLFVFLGTLAFELEAMSLMAASRRREFSRLWPEVVDSMHSAIVSGMSLASALDEIALTGPKRLRPYFQNLINQIDQGWGIEQAIDSLKSSIGEIHADRLCEVLRLVSSAGSESLALALRNQSKTLRKDLALMGQIDSKQGWVTGTAKMAVAAPWIVVAMLSIRPENANVYNSAAGSLILLIGFLVCVFAYRLVHFLGALPEPPRVFSR